MWGHLTRTPKFISLEHEVLIAALNGHLFARFGDMPPNWQLAVLAVKHRPEGVGPRPHGQFHVAERLVGMTHIHEPKKTVNRIQSESHFIINIRRHLRPYKTLDLSNFPITTFDVIVLFLSLSLYSTLTNCNNCSIM